ncbi:MAG: DUF4339 domain-containing protein [Bacteroidota bacterium]|nr:DUF4339 domain-containing protein [Bacteroidota bacterium]
MQRVYLLLRNNKQSGPYTLEELVQQGLNFLDLIWVEGKSTGWMYPVEIEELKPYLSDADQKAGTTATTQFTNESSFSPAPSNKSTLKNETGKKIFVSLPNQINYQPTSREEPINNFETERKNDENRGDSFTSQFAEQPVKNSETHYTRTLNDMEEEYTAWVYNQKTKKRSDISKQKIGLAAVIATILILGYFTAKPLFFGNKISKKVTSNPAIQETSEPETESSVNIQKVANPKEETAFIAIKSKPNTTTCVKEKKQTTVQQKQESVTTSVPEAETDDPKEVITQPSDEPGSGTEEKREAQPKQKKKTLGQKIDDFFGKLSKKEEPAEEEMPKTAPDPKTGERKSRHRGDDQSPASETTNISDFIDITSNEPSGNWMMGIQGLKLTLTNRSNERIETASVEVRYYDEKNNFLEKKMVQFNNVSPKKSQTIAAPDHRLADHVDYRLVSVHSNKETRLRAF